MFEKEKLKRYYEPDNFFNRDLSWIEFNKRVLDEALNPELPLLDKVKFISIFFSNLDEFYMIRVSGIKDQIAAQVFDPTIDGLTPKEELRKIEQGVRPLVNTATRHWIENIVPALREHNVFIMHFDELTEQEKAPLREYFKKEIFPVLTPLAFDPGRPFPYISNLSLSLAVLVKAPDGEKHFARVKVPSILPRLMQLDDILEPNRKKTNSQCKMRFLWLGDLIKNNLDLLFPGMKVLEAHRFRITRDTDIELQEDEADDLLEIIEENIKQRRFGSVVRLEIDKNMPEFMIDTLVENLQITKDDIHILDGPLGLSSVMKLYDLPLHELKEKPFHPVIPGFFDEGEGIFSIISKRDILLHHPYHSFVPVIDFIKTASLDPDVLAIKQTLYRVGPNSPVVKALIEAAEMGKQVAVLVELKARFDEENNIYWAKELEKVGVHVVYGLVGLKTHAKMTLVVRKEGDKVKRYVHLGTGNYNPATAKLYTDLSFFSADEQICDDVSDIFNYLTGYSYQHDFKKLFVAPINISDQFLSLIYREAENAKNGGQGKIVIKLNSLVDPVMIAALYEASNCGVQIDLIVRGICCLVPGKPGISENIRVTSVVGRLLEHSRIYYFHNNGDEQIYLSSADLMPRNLYRRVEIAFPIEDANLKAFIINKIIAVYLKDNIKARVLDADGKYEFIKTDAKDKKINAQEWLMSHAGKLLSLSLKKTKSIN
jgi:polyphosphate kinase